MRLLGTIVGLALGGTVACSSEGDSTAHLLHDSLHPGMTVDQVIEKTHEVYAAHPKAWMFCAVWGTPELVAHDQIHDATRRVLAIEGLTWNNSEMPDAAARRQAAERLKASRQIWFTMRDFGFIHLALTLDGSGRVETVSDLSGHAS